MTTYQYSDAVLEELARHGLMPKPESSPGMLRDALRDLYRYEIRKLRESLLAGRIAKRDYSGHVIALRERYPLLSIPIELWVSQRTGGPLP